MFEEIKWTHLKEDKNSGKKEGYKSKNVGSRQLENGFLLPIQAFITSEVSFDRRIMELKDS